VHASKWINLLPYEWEPKIKYAEQAADLTDRFFAAVRLQSGVRADLAWPPEWEALVKGLNTVLVYEVSGLRSRVHVVVIYATRFRAQRQAEPQILPLDQAYIDTVEDVYRRWRVENPHDHPDFTFFTLGTTGALPANLAGVATADHWLTLFCLSDTGAWDVRVPPPFSYRRSLRDFLDRLKPETRSQRISRIKECVDGLFIEGGNATVDRVRKETGYRRASVQDAFFDMQKQAPETYRLWTKDGQLAIRKAQRGEPMVITSVSTGARFLRRHTLHIIGTVVGAGVGVLVAIYRQRLGVSGFMGFFLAIPILYAGSCFQAAINRRAEKEKE
jgi:hypothetical protein